MIVFLIPAFIVFFVTLAIVFTILEKKRINRHKKNINYQTKVNDTNNK